MFLVGVKDAYFQIPTHLESTLFLSFVVNEEIHQLKAFLQLPRSSAGCLLWRGFEVGIPEGHSSVLLSG